MSEVNKVWIELKTGSPEENETRASLMTTMLARLHDEDDRKLSPEIKWSEHHDCYIKIDKPCGSYLELVDKGHWFNLDYFGREVK